MAIVKLLLAFRVQLPTLPKTRCLFSGVGTLVCHSCAKVSTGYHVQEQVTGTGRSVVIKQKVVGSNQAIHDSQGPNGPRVEGFCRQ